MSATYEKQQYTKFQYKEFGDSIDQNIVVQTSNNLMPEVIVDHSNDYVISHVVEEDEAEDISSIMSFKDPAFDIPENVAVTHTTPAVPTPAPDPAIDIEAIKMEHYRRGYDDAKASLEPELARTKNDDNFSVLLNSKLESITPALDLQDQVLKLSSNLIAVIAKKLHLMVPADFESVILGEMVPLLNKYYKMGAITLNVNPDRVDYCNNLFKIGSLPHRISENIVIVGDESIAKDSCKMEWNDTVLEYNQEELMLDIDKILEHLKVEVNN